eukprot:4574507-Amphidinium_carterae.1
MYRHAPFHTQPNNPKRPREAINFMARNPPMLINFARVSTPKAKDKLDCFGKLILLDGSKLSVSFHWREQHGNIGEWCRCTVDSV